MRMSIQGLSINMMFGAIEESDVIDFFRTYVLTEIVKYAVVTVGRRSNPYGEFKSQKSKVKSNK